MAISARQSGVLLAALGGALSVFHLPALLRFGQAPRLVLLNGILPLGLSVTLLATGVLQVQGRLVRDRFGGRVLAWAGLGALTLVAATGWLFAHALIQGPLPPNEVLTVVNATTLGTLIGQLVGVYDARRHQHSAELDALNRINNTLRIATQDIVDADDRDELEQRVCDRLQASKPYESAWIGRYDPDSGRVRPAAWTGFDDEYYESIEITDDPDDPHGQGAGGRAVRTGALQFSQDVHADPAMEPWREHFVSHGVESVAVVPIVQDESVLGILSVYADRPNVFDDPERQVLTELGETLGHAIDSLQAREQLRARERELARQNEHLEEFASVVSHDLRNPLTVARGYLEQERETRDSENLERIAAALDRMSELIEDILTLARTGTVVSEFEPVNLAAVADAAWETTGTDAATLELDRPLATVSGDESRIRELLENLFRNAVEHAGRDVTVTIGTLPERDGFSVADDGPGVSPAERDAIFEVGFSTNPEGTGFGLNIVRTIADAHGWTVTVSESDAGGARFEFHDVEMVHAGTAEQ